MSQWLVCATDKDGRPVPGWESETLCHSSDPLDSRPIILLHDSLYERGQKGERIRRVNGAKEVFGYMNSVGGKRVASPKRPPMSA